MSLKSQQPLLTTWKCWRRPSRGHGHWLTQELDPGNWSLLYPSPLFIINVPLKPYYCMIIVIDIPIPEGRKWNRHRKEFLVLMSFRIWPGRIPFLGGSDGKCGRPGLGRLIPSWEDLLEEGMETHSSIPAWRIPWTEEPGGLQSMASPRVGND